MKTSNNIHKLFGEKPTPDTVQIQRYLNGEMEGKEAAAFEQAVANDSFLKEALEGFQQNPDAWGNFQSKQAAMHKQLASRSAGFNPLYVAGIALVAVVGVTLLLNTYFNKGEAETSTTEVRINKTDKKEITPIASLSEEEIELAELIVEAKQITTEQVTQAPIKLKAERNISQPKFESLVRVEVEIIQANKPAEEIKVEETVERKNVVFHNAPTIYMHDLMVVDYSKIYTESIPINKFELSGTPAFKANPEDKNELASPGVTTAYIPYKEYLDGAMNKFRENKFKAALKEYQIILKQYPDDINALFYGGLCYYNINRADKALESFEKVVNHSYNTFIEEGYWYKALALLELKRKDEARHLLQQIVVGDGFYSKQARNTLKKL